MYARKLLIKTRTKYDRNIEQRLFAYALFSFSDALALSTLYIFIIPFRPPTRFIYLVASSDSLRHSLAASLPRSIDSTDFLSSYRLASLRPAARQMQFQVMEAPDRTVTCFVTM